MNGAVSHELRNPLSSILSGIDLMKSYIDNLKFLIECLDHQDEKIVKITKIKLKSVVSNVEINCNKMHSSSKFLDYFVHDLLDYTILTNDSKNFIYRKTEFVLADCVDEIIAVMSDKIEMK